MERRRTRRSSKIGARASPRTAKTRVALRTLKYGSYSRLQAQLRSAPPCVPAIGSFCRLVTSLQLGPLPAALAPRRTAQAAHGGRCDSGKLGSAAAAPV
jgi:hypothetical protein